MTPTVDLPPLPFLPSAEERIKMVRWGTEIALAERDAWRSKVESCLRAAGLTAEMARAVAAEIRKG